MILTKRSLFSSFCLFKIKLIYFELGIKQHWLTFNLETAKVYRDLYSVQSGEHWTQG